SFLLFKDVLCEEMYGTFIRRATVGVVTEMSEMRNTTRSTVLCNQPSAAQTVRASATACKSRRDLINRNKLPIQKTIRILDHSECILSYPNAQTTGWVKLVIWHQSFR